MLFLVSKQEFLFLHKILQLDIFKGADFKSHNSFFKLLAQYHPNKAFLVTNIQNGIFGPKFRYFCFSAKFCNQTNSRVLISNMTILFSNSSPKIPKTGIFGTEFRHFCFFVKFCKQANLRVMISNMTILFSNSSPKVLK